MEKNKKKEKMILIVLVLALIILVLSGTYFISKSFNKNNISGENKETNNKENTQNKVNLSEDEGVFDNIIPPDALIANSISEFFDISFEEDGQWQKFHKDGKLYGFEDWHFDGCSKFCCVNEHNETAKASSSLKNQGNISYESSNIVNSNRENAWIEGISGNGIGESVTVETKVHTITYAEDYEIKFTSLVIVNGYAKNEKSWKENNRVAVLKMYYNDEYVTDIYLQDTMNPQFFDISNLNLKTLNNEVGSFRFEISSIYKGTKYQDTAITGINVDFNMPCH